MILFEKLLISLNVENVAKWLQLQTISVDDFQFNAFGQSPIDATYQTQIEGELLSKLMDTPGLNLSSLGDWALKQPEIKRWADAFYRSRNGEYDTEYKKLNKQEYTSVLSQANIYIGKSIATFRGGGFSISYRTEDLPQLEDDCISSIGDLTRQIDQLDESLKEYDKQLNYLNRDVIRQWLSKETNYISLIKDLETQIKDYEDRLRDLKYKRSVLELYVGRNKNIQAFREEAKDGAKALILQASLEEIPNIYREMVED
jgi:hypothetical protein